MDKAEVKRAFTPEWRYPEARLVWALRALLLGLAVFSLGVQPRYTTRTLLVGTALGGLVVSLLFAFIPTRRPRTLKAAEAMTLVAFAMHVGGHAFGWYANVWLYDKTLHFALSIAVALVLFALSQATCWVWSWKEVRPVEVAIYVFCIVVTLTVFWEFVEFGMDQIFGTEEQNGNTDTMIDLLADAAGAMIGAVVTGLATRYGQRHGHDKVSEAPKRPAPTRGPARGA